jgi:ectoine hydroxylase-related dioxygenase (phytanoyl-CoA dioxygenase family)
MSLSGKNKIRLQQLRGLALGMPKNQDRKAVNWAVDILTGKAALNDTPDPLLNALPPDVLRWRVIYAEKHLIDALIALSDAHHETGCTCMGQCLLTHDWVPAQIRLPTPEVTPR